MGGRWKRRRRQATRNLGERIWTAWRAWTNALLGVYLLFSPWIFGTAESVPNSSDALIVGAWVVVMGLCALATPGSWAPDAARLATGIWLLLLPLAQDPTTDLPDWNARTAGILLVGLALVRARSVLAPWLRLKRTSYGAWMLSPEKITGRRGPERYTPDPWRLSHSIVERTDEIYRRLRDNPSDAEVVLCDLGYQICVDDMIDLAILVDRELSGSGPLRRARLLAARQRAADSLARVRYTVPRPPHVVRAEGERDAGS